MSEITRVGVAGCGLMGSGIAEVCARAGLDVVVREVDDAAATAGLNDLRSEIATIKADAVPSSEKKVVAKYVTDASALISAFQDYPKQSDADDQANNIGIIGELACLLADDDGEHGLGKAQVEERHQDHAIDEVLDLERGTGPHTE